MWPAYVRPNQDWSNNRNRMCPPLCDFPLSTAGEYRISPPPPPSKEVEPLAKMTNKTNFYDLNGGDSRWWNFEYSIAIV